MPPHPWQRILWIVYFGACAAALLIYANGSDPYLRPPAFFAFLALAGAACITAAVVAAAASGDAKHSAFGAAAVGLLFIITQQAAYSTPLGVDPWGHRLLVDVVLEKARLPEAHELGPNEWPIYNLVPYLRLPAMHLIIAATMAVTSLGYVDAAMFSVGIIGYILQLLAVYLLTRRMYSPTAAIIAVSVAAIADNVLDLAGKNVFPNSFSVGLLLLVLLAIWKHLEWGRTRTIAVGLLLAAATLIAHTIAYQLILACVMTTWASLWISRRERPVQHTASSMLTILVCAGFGYWFLIATRFAEKFVVVFRHLTDLGASPEYYDSVLHVAVEKVVLARAGMLIFFAVAGAAALYAAAKLRRGFDIAQMGLVIVGGLLSAVAVLNPGLIGVAHRFWHATELIGSISIGAAIYFFVSSRPRTRMFPLLVMPPATLFVFLMLMAPVANNDQPIVGEMATRTGLMASEIAGLEFAMISAGSIEIASDQFYASRAVYGGFPPSMLDHPSTFEDARLSGAIFLFRSDAWIGRLFVLGSPYSNGNHVLSMSEHEFEKVKFSLASHQLYDNGQVTAFDPVKPPPPHPWLV